MAQKKMTLAQRIDSHLKERPRIEKEWQGSSQYAYEQRRLHAVKNARLRLELERQLKQSRARKFEMSLRS